MRQVAGEESAGGLLRVLGRAVPQMFRAAPGLMMVLVLVLLVQGLVPVVSVLLGKWTIDGVQALALGRPGPLGLPLLVGLWAGTALVGQLCGVASTVLQGNVSDRFSVRVISALMDKMNAVVGLDLLEDPRFHDDVELLQQGARFRPLNLTATGIGLLQQVVSVLGLVGALVLIGPWVPLVALLSMIPLARAQLQLRQVGWSLTIQRTQEARELAYDQRVALSHEYAKELRLYGLMGWLAERYRTRAESYQADMRGIRNKQVLGVLPAHSLALVVSAGLFAYAVWQAERGLLTAGSVLLVIQGLAQVRGHLVSVMEYLGMGSEHARWFSKYFAFLDAVPGVVTPARPEPLPERLDLGLEGVSFHYPDGRVALSDLSLHIPEGQTVAIVGENGAGKSTLVKLLLRYYDPTAGRVTVGGADLRTLDPQAWRREVAAVFQDFARFEWTVRENIELAHPGHATELAAALAGSGFGGVADTLPNGLDSRLGVVFGGTELSGGQWQKLATARALYKDARVLVLDEPTAALDPRSEAEVFARFASLPRGRTSLLVTHRLGSVLMADRVLVLRGGRLIEDGTHAELLALNGEYAELWRLQAAQYHNMEVR